MKKTLTYFVFLLSLVSLKTVHAQTFSAYGTTPMMTDFYPVNISNDTLFFDFGTLPLTAYTDGQLTVESAGYLYPGAYYEVFSPDMVSLGTFGLIYNCSQQYDNFFIPFTNLNAYSTGVFKIVKHGDTYDWCNNSIVKASLTYHYCPTGVPTQQAQISLVDNVYCKVENSTTITGATPSGGIYSVDGQPTPIIDPSTLTVGKHYVAYTFIEPNGCYTQDSVSITIADQAPVRQFLLCEGTQPELGNVIPNVVSSQLNLNPILFSESNITLPAIQQSPTSYYVAPVMNSYGFVVDTLIDTLYGIADHDIYSGDDRGGIAITDNYVYIVGDDNTARLDLELQNPVSLPLRDGIFSDLSSRKLYTLYNTNLEITPEQDNQSEFTINALRGMDENLNLTNEIINLTQEITIGFNDNALILAGFDQLVVGDAYGNNPFYSINISSGIVSELGNHYIDKYGSENWADWGFVGLDTLGLIAYYFDSNGELLKYNFAQEISSNLLGAYIDFSDAANLIYHPVNNRMYIHYESSGFYGGDQETILWLGGVSHDSSYTVTAENTLCASEFEYSFNSIDLGPDTTVCNATGVYIVEGGFGYSSYTWNGVNNNYNIYPAIQTETITLNVIDEINCVLTDSITVTFDECLGVADINSTEFAIYPVPNNGSFTIEFTTTTEMNEITILDATGKTVASKTATTLSENIELNVVPGVYFVQVSNAKGTSQRPIVIQ